MLPSPGAVWEAALELIEKGALQEHLLVSLRRAMTGLGIGIAVGTVLAVVAGLSRWGESLVDANMQRLRAMPILALVPLAIVWFGIGEEVKIILVALGVTFPMYLNTHAAIRSRVQSPIRTVAIVAHRGRTSREITSAQTPKPQRVPRSGRSIPVCHRGQTCSSNVAHRSARLPPSNVSRTSKVAWTASSIRLSSWRLVNRQPRIWEVRCSMST